MPELSKLQDAIASLDAQHTALGDGLTDVALAPLWGKLTANHRPSEPTRRQRKLVSVRFDEGYRSTQPSRSLESAGIGDLAWRFSTLENVPEHRAIRERWRGG
jgi:hypothetical protein